MPTPDLPRDPQRDRLDHEGLAHLLQRQSGVVSRRQVLELGGGDADLARMARRRELTRVHPGVHVDHTGPLTWTQRAWAGVLVHWPAALAGRSALPDAAERDHGGAVHVAVHVRRTVRRVPGVVAHRTAGLDERVDWLRSPPRVRLEHAALDVVRGLEPGAAMQQLAEVCHTRRTTAGRLRDALATRRGLPHRALLLALLDDLDAGAVSVLESAYLHRVETAHALPVGERQARAGADGKAVYQDVRYPAHGLVVEIDGRAHHDDARTRHRDSARDLAAAVSHDLRTVRLTSRQVLDEACSTAVAVGALLHRGGWPGPVTRCAACPPVGS